ncbi:MAG: helix-turn-helix transcriptional regulator [Kiritimatiellae bacterium]|nr:helix-turn-helix transcriptional regulator [Kiritimatiellia bacterium]
MPFSLRSVGYKKMAGQPPPALPPPRKHRITDFVQIFWTVTGEGYIRIHGRDRRMKAGQVAILQAGMEHHYYGREKPWEYRWVTVDGPLATALVEGFKFRCEPFRVGPCPVDRFLRLARCMERVDATGEKLATVELYDLLVYIAVQVGSPARRANTEDDSLVEKVRGAIRDGLEDPLVGVGQIAQKLGVDRSSMTRTFKRFTGLSPKGYLDLLRLQRVLSLLKETNLPIHQVSSQAGFNDPNYMAKFFHKRMGRSPSDFREQFQYPWVSAGISA